MRITAGGVPLGLVLVLLACSPIAPLTAATRDASPVAAVSGVTPVGPGSTMSAASSGVGQPQRADFLGEVPSEDARRVADWVVASGDNDGLPFIIIDKIRAKVFIFNKSGRLLGATFALLGKARGDDSVPGIGSQKLSTITPDERTTPAGRFVAELGRDFDHGVLWVDYGDSIAMHRVIVGDPGDHRFQRLATTSALDKRITYGCINVPIKFYDDVVLETFAGTTGIVYILPDTKTIQEVFPISGSADGVIGNDSPQTR